MSRVRLYHMVSLDGYSAGPNQSLKNPLGVGGMNLAQWMFPLKAWRKMAGMKGGKVNASSPVVDTMFDGVGAVVMGRNMFGGYPGPWKKDKPWNGWWGPNPPYHAPVFVVTHYAREPQPMEGGTTFHFVTDGPDVALKLARKAAKGKDVSLAGGATVARHFLKAGLVDDITIHLVPVLLGSGERLFDNLGTELHGLELVKTIAAPGVTHLRFSRKGGK